ncbi:hypothetical protein [Desulfitobacterium metallireducens]|uniref:Uncharacterized protein n=1 Tax=Desulfitobacterium metallireducens DSM 15288 TaxID=871968 RepID=W0EHF0_9FIRM|nr:hypothetical protein [Desulfitobacterium metallireducens]AHF08501.1 hypothetical protein DESME_05435 [Desulfitobacterium metallireducens DSM 15288]
MNGVLDNWAQGTSIGLQTAGGIITGAIAIISEDLLTLTDATINGIAVTLANVVISEIIAAGLVPTT